MFSPSANRWDPGDNNRFLQEMTRRNASLVNARIWPPQNELTRATTGPYRLHTNDMRGSRWDFRVSIARRTPKPCIAIKGKTIDRNGPRKT